MEIQSISEIASVIRKRQTELHRYDAALEPQIISLAGAYRTSLLANRDIEGLETTILKEETRYGCKYVPHPAFKVQRDAQVTVDKLLKSLGLTVEDLAGEVETDPLIELTKQVIDGQQGKATIVRPTKAKQ